MVVLAPFRLIYRSAKRFHGERCAQTAAALSFATLLALVPMFAVAFALISQFPFAAGVAEALEKFFLANLLPEKSGSFVAKYVGQFAHRVERVTWLGVAVLVITALMQMFTIEHAFDAIWGVKLRRPWWRRVAFHLLALLLGPMLFGGSLAALSFVLSTSLGLINEPGWLTVWSGRGLSFLALAAGLGFLYWGVPNKAVSPWHAALGGVLAASAFAGLQKLFATYVSKISTYAVLYGGFSAIPVFLVWIYASWTVVIVGALLVAEMPGSTRRS